MGTGPSCTAAAAIPHTPMLLPLTCSTPHALQLALTVSLHRLLLHLILHAKWELNVLISCFGDSAKRSGHQLMAP